MVGTSAHDEPLLLTVDISNTGIKLGLYPLRDQRPEIEGRRAVPPTSAQGPEADAQSPRAVPSRGRSEAGDTLRARWRIATNREKTADEYAMLLAQLCQQAGARLDAIADTIISSVVPALTPVFQDLATRYLHKEPIVVTYETDLGIKLLVDNPWETGSDRMVSTFAVHHLYGGPAIVIQFGTATSFDCVSAEGDFLGGAIAPGMGISAEALARAGARLYSVEMTPPPAALGKNTMHSMQSGIVYGHVGLVEGLVARLRGEIPGGERAKVIAHGGLAEIVASATPAIDIVDANLLLRGLRLAYTRITSRR